jgi:thioredoxin-dependent peroxiredoxin
LSVSTDPLASHGRFVEKFRLPFLLLANEDKKIAQAYRLWGQKTFMGRKFDGLRRV